MAEIYQQTWLSHHALKLRHKFPAERNKLEIKVWKAPETNKSFTFYKNTKLSNSEIIGKRVECGWMPVVRVYIPNYHECLSSRRIKLRQTVTLAYIHSYIWLALGGTRPLANGSTLKYYGCVDRADNTCAVSILVMIKKSRRIPSGAIAHTQSDTKWIYLDL